jgi:hypothetical protein
MQLQIFLIRSLWWLWNIDLLDIPPECRAVASKTHGDNANIKTTVFVKAPPSLAASAE